MIPPRTTHVAALLALMLVFTPAFSIAADDLFSSKPAVQTAPTDSDLLRTLHESNQRIAQTHQCLTELIQLKLETGKTRNWDAVIAKADACLAIEPSAMAYQIRAAAFREKGDLDSTIADLTRAIAAGHPELSKQQELNADLEGAFDTQVAESTEFLANIYQTRSDIYVQQGDRARAEADLKSALTLTPSSSSTRNRLAKLDQNIAEKAREARIANPQSAADHVLAGQEHWRTRNYQEALSSFDRGIALDSTNVEAHVGRGNALRQLNSLPAAVEAYTRAIALDAGSIAAHTGRGYALRNAKNWKAAIADFSRAIELGGATTVLLIARAESYSGAEKPQAALEDFTAAVAAATAEQNYDRINALTGQGDVQRLLNRPAEALAAYSAAIDSATDYVGRIMAIQAYLGRGRLHATAGRRDLAASDFNTVLKLSTDHAEAKAELAKLESAVPTADGKTADEWSVLGREQAKQRNYAAAVASFTRSIELEPGKAYYRGLRGFVHSSLGNEAEFIADFDHAIKLAPNDVFPYFLRGTCHEMKGRKEQAIADFRRVLEIDPTHAGAKAKLTALGVP